MQEIEANPQAKIDLAQQTIAEADKILAANPEDKDALAAKEAAINAINTTADETGATDTTQTAQQQTVQPAVAQLYQPSYQMLPGIPPVPGFNGYGYDMNVYNEAMSHAAMPSLNTTNNPYMINPVSPYTLNQVNPFLGQTVATTETK